MEACNNKGFLSLVSLVKMFKKIEFSMGLVFMWIYYYYLFLGGGVGREEVPAPALGRNKRLDWS